MTTINYFNNILIIAPLLINNTCIFDVFIKLCFSSQTFVPAWAVQKIRIFRSFLLYSQQLTKFLEESVQHIVDSTPNVDMICLFTQYPGSYLQSFITGRRTQCPAWLIWVNKVIVWLTFSGRPVRKGTRDGKESDSSTMHAQRRLWDAAHIWAVNNTVILARSNMHTYPTTSRHPYAPALAPTCTCMRTNMQCENNVYWWRVAGFVRLGKAVHQVTMVFISSGAWCQNSLNFFQTTARAYAYKLRCLPRIVSQVCFLFFYSIPRHPLSFRRVNTQSTVVFFPALLSLLTLH